MVVREKVLNFLFFKNCLPSVNALPNWTKTCWKMSTKNEFGAFIFSSILFLGINLLSADIPALLEHRR